MLGSPSPSPHICVLSPLSSFCESCRAMLLSLSLVPSLLLPSLLPNAPQLLLHAPATTARLPTKPVPCCACLQVCTPRTQHCLFLTCACSLLCGVTRPLLFYACTFSATCMRLPAFALFPSRVTHASCALPHQNVRDALPGITCKGRCKCVKHPVVFSLPSRLLAASSCGRSRLLLRSVMHGTNSRLPDTLALPLGKAFSRAQGQQRAASWELRRTPCCHH